ncbi:hypothetical protein BLA23254_07956 [Burkholderia lata]|uniref:Uncharacterized protein n=1 Tax=Burkholderia lata (strain ATCC 17760 / DSM 23089 / LMG 22485 / NCIMB 9086 / R18194 / 383) TaxID=482957 RepID=A0A6P2T7B9_BURL3|nr:hypothetical protein BLA23254_07956 [Burkholderia lata]
MKRTARPGNISGLALRNLARSRVSIIDLVMMDRFAGSELHLVGGPALNCLFE